VESNNRTHTKGQRLFVGATNRLPGNNRDTPMHYMPSFLDTQQQNVQGRMEVEDKFEEYARDYVGLSTCFKR
jgi:hypothetical protein